MWDTGSLKCEGEFGEFRGGQLECRWMQVCAGTDRKCVQNNKVSKAFPNISITVAM